MDKAANFIVGAVIGLILWWAGVAAFWYNDMRLWAIVMAVIGIAAIAGTIYGLYKKFANGGW